MRWANDKIGFDDRLLVVLGILGFSVMVPIVFFHWHVWRPPYLPWAAFWPTLVIVSTIWLGCRYHMIWARNRYPRFTDVKRRLVIQNSLILLYSLFVNNVIGSLIDKFCPDLDNLKGQPHSKADVLIGSNAASILCTLLVVATYESVYLIAELKKSITEKELLKQESLQAQVNALKIQVNPHFLFNTLNTLAAVIPENPEQAVDFVQQLSKVYRHILEVKDEPSILLKEELEVLEAYAFLLKTRHGNNLSIHIRVEEEKMRQRIVPLSLQILMENAIKHNIVSAARPLHIDICSEDGRLIVSNNLQKKNQLIESTGIGLDNIRNRYQLLGAPMVEVEEGPEQFIVRIPLIEEYEGINHRR